MLGELVGGVPASHCNRDSVNCSSSSTVNIVLCPLPPSGEKSPNDI